MQLKKLRYIALIVFMFFMCLAHAYFPADLAYSGPLQIAFSSREVFRESLMKKAAAYRDAAFMSFQSGELTESVEFNHKYLNLAPGDTEALLIMARSQFWTQHNEQSFKNYEMYFENGGKEDFSVLYEYASALLASGSCAKAAGVFAKAEKTLDTVESEAAQNIYFNYSFCLLKCGEISKSLKYAGKLKNQILKSDAYELIGDYYYNKFANVTGEAYFDIKSEKILYKKELSDIGKALEYYKKSLAFNEKKKNLNVKIADCLWEKGERKEAVKRLLGVCDELKNPYAYFRMSYFLKESRGTSETNLAGCLELIDKAVKYGVDKSEASYEKAKIYEMAARIDNVKTCLVQAAENVKGGEWFCGSLAKLLIKYNVKSSSYKKFYENKFFRLKFKPEFELLTAYNSLNDRGGQTIVPLNKFILLNNSGSPDYDNCLTALEIFDRMSFWERIKNFSLRLKINASMIEISRSQNAETIKWLDEFERSEKNADEKYRLIKRIAELTSAANDNAAASKKILTALKLEGLNRKRRLEIYKLAFKYAEASADTGYIDEIAMLIYNDGIYVENAYKYLIYKNYWSGGRKIARNCIEKVRENEENSPLAALFDGHEAYNSQKYFKALDFYKKACAGYNDQNYVLKLIEDTRKLIRKNLSAVCSVFSDSTGNYRKSCGIEIKLPGDELPLDIGVSFEKFMKNNILNNNVDLINRQNALSISAAIKKRKVIFGPALNLYSLDRSFNDDVVKIWPAFKISWINNSLSVSASAERKFINDTPLSIELGMSAALNKLDFYNEKHGFIQFGSYQNIKICDGTSRRNFLFGAGLIRGGFTYKLYRSGDNASGGYNGPASISGCNFSPSEVYYAPDNSLVNGIIIDYSQKIKSAFYRFSLNTGKESRNNSGNSKFYGVSAGIDYSKNENTAYSFEINLFKSGFDPLTGANNNNTYKSTMYKLNMSRKF